MKVFDQFIATIAKLRSPEGCPWDKEQTHQTLIPYCIEEAYEVVDAIESNNKAELKKELGDLLLQIVLHAQIASEKNDFTIEEVVDVINQKMIQRHPHVFGDKKLESAQEVVNQWSEIKKKEGQKNTLDGVPKHAPELFRSFQIGKKSSSVGFDWKEKQEVWKKVEEELDELLKANNKKQFEEEFGDVLFSLVQYARHADIDPEKSLKEANEKFRRRFEKMESLVQEDRRSITKISADDWERYWKKAKASF